MQLCFDSSRICAEMQTELLELGSFIWNRALKLCSSWPLIFWMGCRPFYISPTSLSHNPGEQQELWVCLCVLARCVHLCAGSKSITGIAVHSSPTFFFFFSRRVWRWVFCLPGSRGVRSLVGAAEFLARSVRCISWLWHCLTPAAFECSFKACLAECFPLRDLAPFSSPLLLLFFLRLRCSSFLPFILCTSLCPLFCCTPRPLTAAVHLHAAEQRSPLTSTGSTEINAVDGNRKKTARLSPSLVFVVKAPGVLKRS